MAHLVGQGQDVAVARAVDGVAQVEPQSLHGGDVAERAVVDVLRAAHDLADGEVAKICASAAIRATNRRWKLVLTMAPAGAGAVP